MKTFFCSKWQQKLFNCFYFSFRDQQRSKPADYGPFSPESLDATQFSRNKETEELGAIRKMPDMGLSTVRISMF